MKFASTWQISEKFTNIKFHENPSGGEELFQAGWETWKESLFAILQTCPLNPLYNKLLTATPNNYQSSNRKFYLKNTVRGSNPDTNKKCFSSR